MSRTMLRRAVAVATMDSKRRVLQAADILIDGKKIVAVGSGLEEPFDTEIDLQGRVVIPGLVNTHHHLYQTLCRAIPRVQDVELFDWLVDLYQVWRHIDAEAVRVGALVGLGELLLTGCTTSTDHHYLFPQKAAANLIDVQASAARELGIRFHPTRGSMSRGVSLGGLPPDDVVQSEEEILEDSERVIRELHDPEPFSMCRVALAPCSPFSVTDKLMEKSAELARKHGVRLHTHLAETLDEEKFCIEMHGLRPLPYMERVGWLGNDVWYAHGIYFNDEEIEKIGSTGTGVAHCPSSNLRLGSGIAPVPELRAAGAPVGLAVDGSASNDSSNMLLEARQALLVQRIRRGVSSTTAMSVLEMATLGGARVLGRDDIGSIEPGKAADLAIFDTRQLAFAGGMHDPIASLVFCTPGRADMVFVNGELVVKGGKLRGADEDELFNRANTIASSLVAAATTETGNDYMKPRGEKL
ncbi:MAG: 8-oxoguanine deaminase [Deltaproteobacteria bacterium RIFOXYA12_FULL_58_15]|nr:MAG: 8-oxoguanine deaminase [Deltaproteobacteria bacterium RIFOXYA12_FULL_58_15]OGR14489.1 MAG: 8-oxoguanine deaminase [Deltaproteobacteria bacterium RIFOXYB12_FULL_58_9]